MSSVTSKELLAKNLQKSHSSSSLLLSSANLSWTPSTGTAILVTPQPPAERAISPSNSESSKAMTNEELIQTLRLDSMSNSNQSVDVLEGFQTISLNDSKLDDNNGRKSVESSLSNISGSIAEKKLSLLDQLFSTVGVRSGSQSPSTASVITPEVVPQPTTAPNISGKPTPYMSGSYSSPNFGLLPSNTEQNISMSSPIESIPPTLTSVPTAPPQVVSDPPLEPPKQFLPKSYKIKGRLRLYDPNYGVNQTIGDNNTNVLPENTPNPPFCDPLIIPSVEVLYNPNSFVSQTIDSNISSEGLTQTNIKQQSSTIVTSGVEPNIDYGFISPENSNSEQFSFISEAQNQDLNNYQTNDWTTGPNTGLTTGLTTEHTIEQTTEQTYSAEPHYPIMSNIYQPVVHHWFYQKIVETKEVWLPFSMYDSYNLEQAIHSSDNDGLGVVIPTDGGRFDISLNERLRRPIYWSEVDTIVRRCSWFFKIEGHNRWSPYPEDFALKLEQHFRESVLNNSWNRKIEFEGGTESVVMHSLQNIYHYQTDRQMPDGWGQALENPVRPRLVHRGALDGIFDDIDEGEPEKIDHVVFLIHGIGEFCDFRFRTIVEVVDDFRAISLTQMRTHFSSYLESGQLGRIEILPISWHSALHGEETGIDDRLKQITLESIPKLRHFSNDTILDALFYTSPVYCQTIVDNVGQELNRLFALFCQRNPNFCGTVALGGHSLGSLIVFDLLAHQIPGNQSKAYDNTNTFVDKQTDKASQNSQENNDPVQQLYEYFSDPVNQSLEALLNTLGFPEFYGYLHEEERLDFNSIVMLTEDDLRQKLKPFPIGLEKKLLNFIQNYNNYKSKLRAVVREVSQSSNESDLSPNNPINYAFESLGLGFPAINYPTLAFSPSAFFAMGSPIPMFLTVRGVEYLSPDYRLPTCAAVYNIFHPYDPVAYRLEPMIYRSFKDIKPVLIPHHKGRKRMHLELKDSIARMGSDLKSKFLDSLKYTWNSINDFARAHKTNPDLNQTTSSGDDNFSQDSNNEFQNIPNDSNQDFAINSEMEYIYGQNLSAGALNSGRRIDYVLQESPVEAFNEYLFAIRAHTCYWGSEDTALLILRELYGQLGYYTTPGAPLQQSNDQIIPSSTSNHSPDFSSSFELN